MKDLIPLLLVVVLAGCVTTAGTHVEDWDQERPYQMRFDGNPDEAASSLSQTLLLHGFSLVEEDENINIYVYEKALSDDEMISTTALTDAVAGVSSGDQDGRLIFSLQDNGDVTDVVMSARLTVETRQRVNAFQTQSDRHESEVTQGHPLPVKYGKILSEMQKWTVSDPPIHQLDW